MVNLLTMLLVTGSALTGGQVAERIALIRRPANAAFRQAHICAMPATATLSGPFEALGPPSATVERLTGVVIGWSRAKSRDVSPGGSPEIQSQAGFT